MTDVELRDLDAKVHKLVMGLFVRKCKYGHYWTDEVGLLGTNPVPRYSTDIAHAWKVVESMIARGVVFIVKGDGLRMGDHNPKWTVLAANQPRTDEHTAPLAICRAALKATEVTDGTQG